MEFQNQNQNMMSQNMMTQNNKMKDPKVKHNQMNNLLMINKMDQNQAEINPMQMMSQIDQNQIEINPMQQMQMQMMMMNQMIANQQNPIMMNNISNNNIMTEVQKNEEESKGILLVLVFRYNVPSLNREIPVHIICKDNMKVSEVIKRFRYKINEYDKNKRFIFNNKDLNQTLSVSEAGLIHNSSIFVVSTHGVEGGGCPMLFTDVSKNKTKEIKFSKNAPSYRHVCKGINIFGICHCKKCEAYGEEVIVKIKKKNLI